CRATNRAYAAVRHASVEPLAHHGLSTRRGSATDVRKAAIRSDSRSMRLLPAEHVGSVCMSLVLRDGLA
ncbi:MAG: hypothetical protein AVDCRST_MAG17-1262, partial [uncultured Solirubrobacterales bacterium]